MQRDGQTLRTTIQTTDDMKKIIPLLLILQLLCTTAMSQNAVDKLRQFKRQNSYNTQRHTTTSRQTPAAEMSQSHELTPGEIAMTASALYLAGKYGQAAELFEKAAQAGNADAQCALGMLYDAGEGVRKDSKKAFYWMHKAAEQGHLDAQKEVATYYFNGKGVSMNKEQARKWLEKAAIAGHAPSQYLYGLMLYAGEGGKQDYQQAYEWIKKSVDNGYEKGRSTLETMESARTTITIEGNAAIYVDSVYRGQGRWEGILLPFGKHYVQCKKDKHYSSEHNISVSPLFSNTFSFEPLGPICGTLQVTTAPTGAEVMLDGQLIGHTPLNGYKVIIGKHQLETKKNFFATEKSEITIQENKITEQSLTLKSSLPIKINTSPSRVQLCINDQTLATPVETMLPEGTYNIKIPRQHYGEKGIMGKNTTVTFDSLHLETNIHVKTDNNYDYATFLGFDYDTGLDAVGINIGSNVGKHFMFEMNFFWGLKKSEPVYWTAMQKASLNNGDLQKFDYCHWTADLRLGPTFWCGPFLRLSPQLGTQYLRLRESAVGDGNVESGFVKGGYICALGAIRFRFSLSQHVGIHITPEYRYNLSNKKVLPDLTHDIDKWVNGFAVKAGILFFWY